MNITESTYNMPLPPSKKLKRSDATTPRGAPGAPDTSALDQCLGYSLRRAQLSTYPAFNHSMHGFLIRPSQFAVLVLIRHNPGLSQAAVSQVLDIKKTNLVPLLDGLETRGLVARRKAKADRRAFALHLTSKGETFVEKMEARHNSMETVLRERLGEKASRQLLQLAHAFTKSLPR